MQELTNMETVNKPGPAYAAVMSLTMPRDPAPRLTTASPSAVARRRPPLRIDRLLASLASSRLPLLFYLLFGKAHHAAALTHMARPATLGTAYPSPSVEIALSGLGRAFRWVSTVLLRSCYDYGG